MASDAPSDEDDEEDNDDVTSLSEAETDLKKQCNHSKRISPIPVTRSFQIRLTNVMELPEWEKYNPASRSLVLQKSPTNGGEGNRCCENVCEPVAGSSKNITNDFCLACSIKESTYSSGSLKRGISAKSEIAEDSPKKPKLVDAGSTEETVANETPDSMDFCEIVEAETVAVPETKKDDSASRNGLVDEPVMWRIENVRTDVDFDDSAFQKSIETPKDAENWGESVTILDNNSETFEEKSKAVPSNDEKISKEENLDDCEAVILEVLEEPELPSENEKISEIVEEKKSDVTEREKSDDCGKVTIDVLEEKLDLPSVKKKIEKNLSKIVEEKTSNDRENKSNATSENKSDVKKKSEGSDEKKKIEEEKKSDSREDRSKTTSSEKKSDIKEKSENSNEKKKIGEEKKLNCPVEKSESHGEKKSDVNEKSECNDEKKSNTDEEKKDAATPSATTEPVAEIIDLEDLPDTDKSPISNPDLSQFIRNSK